MRREPIDQYFRIGILKLLGTERGAQARLAREAEVSASQLNDILKGRSSGSEETRRAIAKAIGRLYEDIISIGKGIAESSQGAGNLPSETDEVASLLKKARIVLKSGQYYAKALKTNIIAFHLAVTKGPEPGPTSSSNPDYAPDENLKKNDQGPMLVSGA